MSIEKLDIIIQKTLPLVYDDSLSYLEFLAKVVAKVNEAVEELNIYLNQDLRSYVEQKLIAWKDDGTLDTMIADAILDIGNRQYTEQNYVTNGETLSDSVDALDVKVKEDSDSVASHLVAAAPHFSVLSAPELTGKKIEVVAGVLRQNEADPSKWDFINDGFHVPVGVNTATITASSSNLMVLFNKTFGRVISFVVGPDEYLANRFGMQLGASVALDSATIKASAQFAITSRIYFDETTQSWIVQSGSGSIAGEVTVTNNGGIVTITHPPILGINTELLEWSYNTTIIPYQPLIISQSDTQVSFRMLNTTTRSFVAAPDKHFSFYFKKRNQGGVLLDGSGGHNSILDFHNGNIWFFGLFEV